MKWPKKKICEIATILRGAGLSKKELDPKGKNKCILYGELYTLYDPIIKEVKSRTNVKGKVLSMSGDVLVPGTTTADALGIAVARAINEDGIIIGGDINIIRTNNKIVTADFLSYLLNGPLKTTLANEARGAMIFHLSGKKIGELEIPLPPLAEQKRIVEKIEKLFAKIDQTERLRQEASADAAALLPSALQQVFSRQKWPTKKLGEVTILNPKKSEIKDLSNNIDVSFVPMVAVNGNTQTITNNEIRKLKEVKRGFTYFRNGDVIFAKITPCMENGKIAIARDLKNGIGFGSTEFHVIRPTDKILPEWIFTIVRSQNFRDEAEKHMTGTAGQHRVPVEFLKNVEIPLPPIVEQKRIVAYLDSISQKAQELQNIQRQTAADFSALRQSILASAFSQ